MLATPVMENHNTEKQDTTYLKQLLDDRNWTIDQLHDATGISYSQTWAIVTKGIKFGTQIGNIEKIANALDVSIQDILDNQPWIE